MTDKLQRICASPYNTEDTLFEIRDIEIICYLVVRTLCYGRSNPGPNPGPGMVFFNYRYAMYLFLQGFKKICSVKNIYISNYKLLETSPGEVFFIANYNLKWQQWNHAFNTT